MQLFLLFVLWSSASEPATAAAPNIIACEKPSPSDDRPYTLCLAETAFEGAKANLDRQWKITIAQVEAAGGASAADRLRNEQLKWIKARDSECEALAGQSPSTQVGRNQMSCLAQRTESRTAELRALAEPASAPQPDAELQDARNATHRLDQCLQRIAQRLSESKLSWPGKYDAYFQSCPTERRITFKKMLAYEWAHHQPRNQSERLKVYDIAKARVEDRYDIWTLFLDPHPVMF